MHVYTQRPHDTRAEFKRAVKTHYASRTGIHHLHIGTLIVSKDGKLSGRFTNHDLSAYAMAPGRDPVMTKAQEEMHINGATCC